MLMDTLSDLIGQFQFGPRKTLSSLDVPCSLDLCQICFHNHHILRPAEFHCLCH